MLALWNRLQGVEDHTEEQYRPYLMGRGLEQLGFAAGWFLWSASAFVVSPQRPTALLWVPDLHICISSWYVFIVHARLDWFQEAVRVSQKAGLSPGR